MRVFGRIICKPSQNGRGDLVREVGDADYFAVGAGDGQHVGSADEGPICTVVLFDEAAIYRGRVVNQKQILSYIHLVLCQWSEHSRVCLATTGGDEFHSDVRQCRWNIRLALSVGAPGDDCSVVF